MGQKTSDSNAGRIAPLSDGVHFQVRKPEDKAPTITTPKKTATIRGIWPNDGCIRGMVVPASFHLVPRLRPGNARSRSSASFFQRREIGTESADKQRKQSFRDRRSQAGAWEREESPVSDQARYQTYESVRFM